MNVDKDGCALPPIPHPEPPEPPRRRRPCGVCGLALGAPERPWSAVPGKGFVCTPCQEDDDE